MSDALLLLLCLYVSALILVVFLAARAKRKREAALWAASELSKNLDAINVQIKTLRQQDAWHPGDPKTLFMIAHLERKLRNHNEVTRAISERLKS